MRRVICDLLIVITTISTVEPEPPLAESAAEGCLPVEGAPAALDRPLVVEEPSRWVLYQEFLFVHYQRDSQASSTTQPEPANPTVTKPSD